MTDRGFRFGNVTHATSRFRRLEFMPVHARGRVGVMDINVMVGAEPSLPTYSTVADVLEKKNGSGTRLIGWTLLRILMIAPPMVFVGVAPALAFKGAALSSALISLFTLIRIQRAAQEQGVTS